MSEGQPPEKPTTQLPAVPQWAIELTMNVKQGFAAVESRLDVMESNLELQGGSVVDIGKRLTSIESRVGEAEARLNNGSLRAKELSGVDLKHDAAIAQLVTDVAEVKATNEKQLAILTKLENVAANPMVRRIAYALGTLILGYLAAKGVVTK